jgi:chemotaxis family two-component system sensor kinase Cph1
MKILPTIVCDHVRITEVFQNIIGNALKYNDNNNKKVEIGYREDHPAYPGTPVYYVKDNGIGIEEKNLDSIFHIFRRLHSQEAYGGGVGAGLSIARKIILQHHGKIWAESGGRQKGTTFFFTIPAQRATESIAA